MEKKGRKVELTRCKGLVPMLLLGSLGLSTAATYLQDAIVSKSPEDTNESEIECQKENIAVKLMLTRPIDPPIHRVILPKGRENWYTRDRLKSREGTARLTIADESVSRV